MFPEDRSFLPILKFVTTKTTRKVRGPTHTFPRTETHTPSLSPPTSTTRISSELLQNHQYSLQTHITASFVLDLATVAMSARGKEQEQEAHISDDELGELSAAQLKAVHAAMMVKFHQSYWCSHVLSTHTNVGRAGHWPSRRTPPFGPRWWKLVWWILTRSSTHHPDPSGSTMRAPQPLAE